MPMLLLPRTAAAPGKRSCSANSLIRPMLRLPATHFRLVTSPRQFSPLISFPTLSANGARRPVPWRRGPVRGLALLGLTYRLQRS